MRALQFLLRVSPAFLLLVLCLQLEINKAEESIWKVIQMDLQMPTVAVANEEVTVKLGIQTELKECMVIKAYLRSNIQIDGPFNYRYTSCLCDDYPRTFYWDLVANRTATIAAVVDIIRELDICPEDRAVVPIKSNRYYVLHRLNVS
ncbi:prolactin-inducible protein homolog precursor [Oryctolagus cuniculus]|uniref:Prolactin-inducible protein homolog n=1 Tax=Oryctolagus cuniculus TaxID=9986 RepID=PIP_RABIT|nr:prolactin-inducible protein homolog precursor [Oryctolagus cuniculus]P60990.1 RecName: Full=Prolactin-inducible protein homolog; AltName: Full=Prolactin-induced protein; Flags: Precursor [Oryctolagus cuniculus]BAD04926.1 prolactin inducible protein [Oryctolagus cuniculus]